MYSCVLRTRLDVQGIKQKTIEDHLGYTNFKITLSVIENVDIKSSYQFIE